MKIVVTGKGGTGKTTLSAILARSLARRGREVVALDGDPHPNLGIALGLGLDEMKALDSVVNARVRKDAAPAHSHGPGESHDHDDVEAVLDRLGVVGPDRVRLVQAGRIERPADGCLCCGSHVSLQKMYAELEAVDRDLVADLEPGPNGLIWTKPGAGDTVVVVTGPYRKSLEVATRTVQVAGELGAGRVVVAANRLGDEAGGLEVRAALGDVEVFEVPEDPDVRSAYARALSVVDTAPGSGAVAAVGALADSLAP